MRNWKELGEIPDSEEEDGFDTQSFGSQGWTAEDANVQTASKQQADVWDVPLSQDEDPEATNDTPIAASQHLPTSPVAETTLQRDPWDVPSSQREDEPLDSQYGQINNISPPQSPLQLVSSPLSTLSSISFEELPQLSCLVRTDQNGHSEAPSRQRTPAPVLIDMTGISPISTPPRLPMVTTPAISSELGERESEYVARQAAFRYERSLRTRKPIQQHPFLLEAAQYRTSMQSRGLKPLRIAAMETEKRRKEGETQERPYEPESQDSNGGNGSGSRDHDTDLFGDFDDWAMPSSSPVSPQRAARVAAPSSQNSSHLETDGTSVQLDELGAPDELPALADLISHPRRPSNKYTPKRRPTSPRTSSKKKQRRLVLDSDDVLPPGHSAREPSPDPLQEGQYVFPPSSSFEIVPDFLEARKAALGRQQAAVKERQPQSPTTPVAAPEVMLIDSETETERNPVQAEDDDGDVTDGNESAADGGERIVSTVGRRIRGVLPASWLRLDQQSGRENIRKVVASRNAHRSPEREQRRGVAQKRRRTETSGQMSTEFWSDESDVDTPNLQRETTDEAFPNQTRLAVDAAAHVIDPWSSGDDGAGSAMEDNQVDHMPAPRKRQMKLADSFSKGSKRQGRTHNSEAARSTQGPRQPKIAAALSGASKPSSSALQVPKKRRKDRRANPTPGPRGGVESRQRTNRTKTSRLSILDVIEPDAPRFLKIAARTVKRRPNQGRDTPTKKSIRLANREDHVDALSVLYQWRKGSIPQRPAVTSAVRKSGAKRHARPLTETSGNQAPPKSTQPHRKSSGAPNALRNGSNVIRNRALFRSGSSLHGSSRPAQLETSGSDPVDSRTFYSGKRALDRLFKKTRAAPSTVDLLSFSEDLELRSNPDQGRAGTSPARDHHPTLKPKSSSQKSRYRKRTKPVREDLEAPQFVHAHDPLPRQQDAIVAGEPVECPASGVKMTGLGPYGTQYTRHFEIFPLPMGVYFHETSLIGRGLLTEIVEHPVIAMCDIDRPRGSYFLGNQTLRWGQWSEKVSSELGILFDFIGEKLEGSRADNLSPSSITGASDFVLSYIKDHISFAQGSDVKAFFTRFQEVLYGFNAKIQDQVRLDQSMPIQELHRTYERLVLAALCVLQMCRAESSMVKEQFQAEDTMKAVAATAIALLMRSGTSDLRQEYRLLNASRNRDQGLREQNSTLHSWVIVMKALDDARILRASFWDMIQANLATRDYITGHDAEKHDLLWQDLFSFLPLVEFNNKGLLVPGSRHDVLHEGWTLPLKLLKSVFQLYRENYRQPPSFNNYCRALVGRCHYLVEQWGWKKSSSVIGVIFDFFGSQNLAHLRNEEVYQSPRFLEDLAREPRLDIEPEDRCFHVFLKLVALSIRKLRDVDAIKDIKNLVARTMPNHSRHHLKEQTLHERDLAALRNHHDLLCTLFWACPPDLRPSAALIEGLVDPASSHKETCLISLRSWSQLARFLVANGEASTGKVFGPFVSWRDGFFSKVLQQYTSIASEINQQFHCLAKEERQAVSDDMLKAMITANKIAVQDVLHLSLTASHEVMVQCPDLEAAVWSLSTKQLQQVFDHFSAAPPELDWSVLNVSLKTLAAFLAKIDDFKDAEESQQRESQLLDSEQADDALQTLDECVAKKYFAMARCVLSNRGEAEKHAASIVEKAACKELVVTLSSRFASRLISSGAMRIGQFFKYSKYGLFDGDPQKLDLEQRRYLVLCVVSLLKSNVDDFGEAGFSLLDIWLLSIVKPREGLCWENQLAEQLQRIGFQFVPEAAADLAMQPHYSSNKDMFEFAISRMRTIVRESEPTRRKTLVSRYAPTLKVVMEQMTTDLKTVSGDTSEHPAYVSFVRGIISLIRSHGADICAVEDFFYQISKDYSPPVEDPQLQIAGMISYELKMSDPGTRQQLFFFMLNSFKLAINKDQLEEHAVLLHNSLRRPALRKFVLGKLFPAVLGASWQQPAAHVLVDLCVESFDMLLAGNILSTQLTPTDLEYLQFTIAAIARGFRHLSAVPHAPEVYLINRMLTFLNLIWPSVLIMFAKGMAESQLDSSRNALAVFKSGFEIIKKHLELANGYPYWETSDLLRATLARVESPDVPSDPDVTSFQDNIIADIKRNWYVSNRRVGIMTPAKSRGTQSSTQTGLGVEVPERDVVKLYQELKSLLAIWIDNYEDLFERVAKKRRGDYELPMEDTVF